MNRKDARVTPLRTRPRLLAPATSTANSTTTGAQIGRIVAIDKGIISVALPDTTRTCAAKLAVTINASQLRQAVESQQPVVLVFENGAANKPIIVGFVAPVPADHTATAQTIEADVDGRRVKLVGKDEIVLECGKASITLRRNGRVVIRGTHIESDSDGANRIKGGQVRIN